MDSYKLYGRSEEEQESLINVVWVFSQDIGMKFGLDKCAVLKQGVQVHCEGIVLPVGQVIGEVNENGYLEGADIMQKEVAEVLWWEFD